MKKLFTALFLFAGALALFVLNDTLPLPSVAASQDAVSRFVNHPSHCDQLLGQGLGGDTANPAMHTALEAALDATRLPADQAIGRINNQCKERAGELERLFRNAGT